MDVVSDLLAHLRALSRHPDAPFFAWSAALALILVVAIKTFHTARLEQALRFQWECPPEADPAWKGKILDQPSIHADGAGKVTAYDPSTGARITAYDSLSVSQMDEHVSRASKAALSWRRTSFAQRRQVMRSLLQWIIENKTQIAQVCVRDTGKTMLDAALGEILTTCEKIRWMIAYGEHYLKPDFRPTSWLLAHKISHVHYDPLGVVAAIVSWNYPLHNLFSPVLAALMSGNAIVVKTSENVSWSSYHFGQALRACLERCGHDPDTIQVAIGCEAEAAIALTRNPQVSHLTFIGSDKVGKEVARNAAEALTPVTLELGGKDPAILLKSADVAFFQDVFLKSVFTGAGQGCIMSERYIVHEAVYSTFLSIMTKRVPEIKPGVDIGAMINGARLQHLADMVQEAVKDGAKLLAGGKQYHHSQFPGAHYFEPTLLADVTQDMRIAREECFAPVMLVMKARSTEECIAIANASPYGLGSAVYGRDKADCRYVASQLKCGMVSINDFGVFYLNQSLPFGGVKSSGYARFGGPEGLRALCNTKAVTVDRFHNWVQTSIPPPLKYPVASAKQSWRFVCGLIDLMYHPAWTGKLAAIGALVLPGPQ